MQQLVHFFTSLWWCIWLLILLFHINLEYDFSAFDFNILGSSLQCVPSNKEGVILSESINTYYLIIQIRCIKNKLTTFTTALIRPQVGHLVIAWIEYSCPSYQLDSTFSPSQQIIQIPFHFPQQPRDVSRPWDGKHSVSLSCQLISVLLVAPLLQYPPLSVMSSKQASSVPPPPPPLLLDESVRWMAQP